MDGMRCPTTDRTRAALGGLRDGEASGTTDLRGVTTEALPDLGGKALRLTLGEGIIGRIVPAVGLLRTPPLEGSGVPIPPMTRLGYEVGGFRTGLGAGLGAGWGFGAVSLIPYFANIAARWDAVLCL